MLTRPEGLGGELLCGCPGQPRVGARASQAFQDDDCHRIGGILCIARLLSLCAVKTLNASTVIMQQVPVIE
jgi:hypothetical protein